MARIIISKWWIYAGIAIAAVIASVIFGTVFTGFYRAFFG
jgi:hypothetical protein